jgi:hypothetical protein
MEYALLLMLMVMVVFLLRKKRVLSDKCVKNIKNNYYVQSYYWVTSTSKMVPKIAGGTGWCRRCVEGRKVRRVQGQHEGGQTYIVE